MIQYLTEVLRRTPRCGRVLETGVGSGYGSVWLSLRGIQAEGMDYSPGIVERARQVNSVLGGQAQFALGDLFNLHDKNLRRYDAIHHQGVLEHFTGPKIRAALAQQVACANHVVFSVPSVNYPFEPEFGDERLLPLEEWARILEPFQVEDLRYYGDPNLGAREQILCVLRGQPVDEDLMALMHPGAQPYREGVSAIVHTRNEAARIAECLQTLAGWADEIIVCDMESDDDTVAIASQFTDQIVRHPRIPNFDRARNVSAMRARHAWVFFLDADERVPARLGQQLRRIALSNPAEFDAMLVPFRHHFAGHWMRSMYPGYTAPRLLRNGSFVFNARLHSGAQVDGPVIAFPADDPDLALVHYSFDSFSHYLGKLNGYTDGEALNMHRDGQVFHWQNAIAHFVHDFQNYYEKGNAPVDGVHGFLYSFMSAFYRFEQHAKLFERRWAQGQVSDWEQAIPASMEEMLEYALRLTRAKPARQATPVRVSDEPGAARFLWSGPVRDRSGYGDESRQMLLALEGAGAAVAAQSLPWGERDAAMPGNDLARLENMEGRAAAPGFTQLCHTFATQFQRHPQAGVCIGRTIFETDRLPKEWVAACNRMDFVWVATEFNRQTFAQAGVEAAKLVVVPECLDAAPYRSLPSREEIAANAELPQVVREIAADGRFTFLSVFDWTRHKGWDVLLRAFLGEFAGRDDVRLAFKVWSTMGYDHAEIRRQASELASRELGVDLASDPRVLFIDEYLPDEAMRSLYIAADAYVLPSRGEGWGRPYMEAMACGLPAIATGWSGNTAFMTPENSYLAEYDLVSVPEQAWREVATYKGHRWAEPRLEHVKSLMRGVVLGRDEARAVGARGREHVLARFSREAVGPLIRRELERAAEAGRASGEAQPGASAASVRWEGAIFRQHSLGHVNRELCLGMLGGGVDLSLVPTEPNDFSPADEPRLAGLVGRCFAPLDKPADVHVRHGFPPRFDAPDEGRFVLMQPWEYGYLPRHWVEPIQDRVAEVWCNSGYVRDVYLSSGIPPEKLAMVPLGADADVFHPGAPPFVLTDEPGASRAFGRGTERPFIFLFVGGTLHRKGFDILLEAYLKAFSAYDDVLLLVKDTCTKTVYQGQNHRERLIELAGDASRPRIAYVEDDLTAHQLAGVFTAADCLVAPYRGEGFCLPVLEAMSCGVPAIVTGGGPTDDFVDETVGWRLPAAKVPFGDGKIGEWECAGPTWMFEVSVDDLAKLMRQVSGSRKETQKRGKAAAKRVRSGWTWVHATARIMDRLKALRAMPSIAAAPADTMEALGTTAVKPSLPASTGAPTISLCMIVKNEERVLGNCLQSIRAWVDEIIVVDTGSTDRTVEIAEEHGARVFHFPWTDSFSEARNVSLSHATCDWILWMDADDTIPEHCGAKLREFALLTEAKVTGLIMQVRIPPAPGEVGLTVVDHVKLFRNHMGLQFEGRIHEQILGPIYSLGGIVKRTDAYVVHSGYDYSPEGQAGKRKRDLALLEKDLAERPDHPFVLFNIGMTAYHMKDYPKAVSALERCLAVSQPQESTVRKVYAMLAGCALETKDLMGARRLIETGLALFPKDPELLFRAGIVYKEVGSLDKAEASYLKLLNDRETGHIDSIDETMVGFKAHHNLALVYLDMSRFDDAVVYFRHAVQQEPSFVPSLVGLGDLLISTGRFSEAERIVENLERLGIGDALRMRYALQATAVRGT
ncbi:glycosyltransferase [Capsulimonas corticalis]|nr:glycosyltransferase [Capsulimonas corticalis]